MLRSYGEPVTAARVGRKNLDTCYLRKTIFVTSGRQL
jgi:hypothetical protein